MASITEQTVNDGFMRGVDAGVSVQIGTKAQLRVSITIKAKTVSNVFKELRNTSKTSGEQLGKTLKRPTQGER